MERIFALCLLSLSLTLPAYADDSDPVEAATGATLEWLALTDAGQYESSWESASTLFRSAVSSEDWHRSLAAVRTPIGALESREMINAAFSESLPGAPDGAYVVSTFESSFENKATAIETVTAMKDVDGEWRVAGYFIR